MAQIFLLSIGSMSIAYHFVTTTIWAIHCYCYHMNFYLSTNLCFPVYHNLPKFTTTCGCMNALNCLLSPLEYDCGRVENGCGFSSLIRWRGFKTYREDLLERQIHP